MLLDSHYHFDFLQGTELRRAFLREIAAREVRIVAQTLTPSSFVELVRSADNLAMDDVPLPDWSLGFHPWHIASREQAEAELQVFAAAVESTRFIGEIGLDFVPKRLEQAPRELQLWVLRRVLELVVDAAASTSRDEPYVLSLHAVRSAGAVVELLEELRVREANVVPVFHRFTGTSDELTALIRLGGSISVHPQMFETKRGRHYVQQVPAERLLLESDLPVGPVYVDADAERSETAAAAAQELADALSSMLDTLTALCGDTVAADVATTSQRLYAVSPC